ncbi:hypothetical protein BT63DRAFT_465245 [Microthyrium microscopicum]|uniref:Coagulation factor 5/8 type domain-containing protein n=1 Tax=Microthyrium microscopicum TaxID=703497 RepID=A0A6A6U0D9_9PEZI|nr:hypothetical protein BT63DRAFT_465245 [Microthyrium microscopicum]
MRSSTFLAALLLQFLIQNVLAESIRAIYLFKDVMKSNTAALKTSGFNTLIMFGVGVIENGDIKYYSNTPGSKDVLIASKGTYVGGDALAQKVGSFKAGNGTGVNRLEISMNSNNVRNLMSKNDQNLLRNFQALKKAWSLDAVNNDDEKEYDAASTVAFAKMLGKLGYKYTIAPYTRTNIWSSVISQCNKGLKESERLLDRVYLQCYDGGVRNDPVSWQKSLGMKVVPLIWVTNDSKPGQGNSAAQSRSRFSGWHQRESLGGGGYWNDFDIEKMKSSYKQYGDVLTSVFK